MAENTNTLNFVQLSETVKGAIQGNTLHLRVDLGGEAKPSSTGKMVMFAVTGGFKDVANGFRVNVMAGKNATKPATE